MAVSVRKPVLYAFGVVLCAGIIGGIWLWYRTHCVLITNDSRIEGTLVSVASRLSDRVVQVMVNEGDTVHKGQGLVRIDSRSVMARKAKAEAALELAKARWEDAKAGFRRQEIMAAQAHLDQAQAMLERAGRDFRRMEQLARNDGGVTQADRDAASSAYRAAQANVAAAQEELALKKEGSRPEVIRAAEAQVMQAQAELDEINVLCQDSVIPSPVNGVVARERRVTGGGGAEAVHARQYRRHLAQRPHRGNPHRADPRGAGRGLHHRRLSGPHLLRAHL